MPHFTLLYFVLLGLNVLLFAWLGAYVATQKNREPIEGAALGALLSVLGVLIEALLPTHVVD